VNRHPALIRSVMTRHGGVCAVDLRLLLPDRATRPGSDVFLCGNLGSVLPLCDGSREIPGIVAEPGDRFPGASVAGGVPRRLSALRREGRLR